MGKKIFVSYKYADDDVLCLNGQTISTVRDYVNELEQYFDMSTDHIYKGESDDEDMSAYSDDEIWEKLKDRIFDSSVTIVMISPNMKVNGRSDKSQWIPWEISFSLKETTRNDRTSHTNAMLAIVLPDVAGSYDYYLSQNTCGAILHKTDTLFDILRNNKFNIINPQIGYCPVCGRNHYYGNASYITAVKWNDFIVSPNFYIDEAVKRQNNIDNYSIRKNV